MLLILIVPSFRLQIRQYMIKNSISCMVSFNFLWMFILMKQFQHIWDYVLSNERLLSRCKLYYCMHIDVHTYSYDNILWNVYLPSSLSLTTQNSKLMCYKWSKSRGFFNAQMGSVGCSNTAIGTVAIYIW